MSNNEQKTTVTPPTNTNLVHVLEYFDAGIFREKVEALLSEVSRGVVNHADKRQKGKLDICLTIERVGESNQVMIGHKVAVDIPTKRGKRTEQDTTETPFFVGRGGKLTFDQPKEEISGQFSLRQQQDGVIPVTQKVNGNVV